MRLQMSEYASRLLVQALEIFSSIAYIILCLDSLCLI